MSNFTTSTNVKRTRKPHRCLYCSGAIEIGSAAIRVSGAFEGQIFAFYVHEDCSEATHEWNEKLNLWDEDRVYISECDDFDWLREKYPTVAARLENKAAP